MGGKTQGDAGARIPELGSEQGRTFMCPKTPKADGLRTITLFEALLTWIVTVSIVSVVLLVFNAFYSINALIIGSILFVGIFVVFKLGINFNFKEFNIGLFLILLIALLFRSEPYLWLMGGQDQGIYVNMSSTYERTGSAFIKDNLREKLSDDRKDIFDKEQILYRRIPGDLKTIREMYPREYDPEKSKSYFAMFLPGMYLKDLSKSEYVFQFYPLHPLWMAISGKLLGGNNRVYSLVLFSLLSIVIFYFLALEFSGGKKLPAYLVAVFMALNPLHAFFSKFPVTEVVSIFFSSAGFYCLIRYHKESQTDKRRWFNLILSVGLFFCLFFNHIAGFMYMPLFYGFFIVTLIFANEVTRKPLIIYNISILAVFALSVIYGLFYSFPYFYEIYSSKIGNYLGNAWDGKLLLIGLLGGILLFAVNFLRNRVKDKVTNVVPYIYKNLPLAIYLVILLGLYKAYQLGFTDKYINILGPANRWNMAHLGWESLKYSNIYVLILYLSPFGFLLFLGGVYHIRKQKNILLGGLGLFLSLFLFIRIVVAFNTPYQYYYARYLLSEVVPLSFLLISLYLGDLLKTDKTKRVIAAIFIAAILVYSLYYTSHQFKGMEGDGVATALEKVAGRLDENDLLAITFKDYRVIMPLKYYYNLNVIYADDIHNKKETIVKTFEIYPDYNDRFVLSDGPIADENLEPVDIIAYKQGMFGHSNRIPTKFRYFDSKNIYLYRIPWKTYFNVGRTLKPKFMTLSGFYDEKIWTNGSGIMKNIACKVKPDDRYLVIDTKGWNPYKDDLKKLDLRILTNEKDLEFDHKDNNSYYFKLNNDIKKITEIRIISSVFVPQELGINNNDKRRLGIDVDLIRFE